MSSALSRNVLTCSPIRTMFDVAVIIIRMHSEFCHKRGGGGTWLYTTVLQCMDEECRKVNVKQECAVKIT